MDVAGESRGFHIPPEIVDQICSHLAHDVHDIQSANLVCKAMQRSARPMLFNFSSSPAEMFLSHTAKSEPFAKVWPDESYTLPGMPRRVDKPLTIWTCIDIPLSVLLEDAKTDVGSRFVTLICAPTRLPNGLPANIKAERNEGRKAICWGRISEIPDRFWIVWQWDSTVSWSAYLQSEYARSLRDFLDEIAPGCSATSRSERVPLHPKLERKRPLFGGFYEVRTIYFAPSMTREQKASFEKTHHLKKWLTGGVSSGDPRNMGSSQWCWLRGLRILEGQTAVAARFVFNWKSPELEKSYQATMERQQYSGGHNRKVVDIFMDELVAAGMLGWESLHCNFIAGPWRN